jgi:hypothetical protein
MFGSERLATALATSAVNLPLADRASAIRDAVRGFEAGQPPFDDLTLSSPAGTVDRLANADFDAPVLRLGDFVATGDQRFSLAAPGGLDLFLRNADGDQELACRGGTLQRQLVVRLEAADGIGVTDHQDLRRRTGGDLAFDRLDLELGFGRQDITAGLE